MVDMVMDRVCVVWPVVICMGHTCKISRALVEAARLAVVMVQRSKMPPAVRDTLEMRAPCSR